jgi:hypothetical protein
VADYPVIIPFYFAWVDAGTAFDPVAHARSDETVANVSVQQVEGDCATMSIVVRNPKIGLLAPNRKVWAWFSWKPGSTVEPLFFGRLVGIPSDINKELVTLMFTARPADFVAQKTVLAEVLKVAPFYDPVWINATALDDPDTVLEARPELWHIDRVTHVVSTSDIIVGEDGTEIFEESEVPYDTVNIQILQNALRSVSVDAGINWTQSDTGGISFAVQALMYTGGSFIQDWPKLGASLKGGWKVSASSITDLNDVQLVEVVSYQSGWKNIEKTHSTGDTMSLDFSASLPLLRGPAYKTTLTTKEQTGVLDPGDSLSDAFGDSDPVNIPAHFENNYLYVPLWNIQASMTLTYDAARARKERVRFTLVTNVQPLITEPEDSETMIITLDSIDVSLALPGGEVPIVDLRRRSYIDTDRGLQSLEYLIALARANLLHRSRAIQVKFNCTLARAVELSCRKNAQLFDPRLPGGTAVGKISGYSFSVDTGSGQAIGEVTMLCAIGYGGAVASAPGTPTYCTEGYVAPGYQKYENKVVVLPASDVGYTVPTISPNDDGIRFPLVKRKVVVHDRLHFDADGQLDVIVAAAPANMFVANANPLTIDDQDELRRQSKLTIQEALKNNAVWYELELKSLTGGPFVTEYDIEVTQLEIPKMIDLLSGAPS